MTINKLDTNGYWTVRRFTRTNGTKNYTDNNPVHIYIPSTPCKIERSNVVGSGSGRGEDGKMYIQWVRRDVRKIIYHLNMATGAEIALLESLMQGREFEFTFLQDNATQTIDAYAGESSYEHYSYALGDKLYQNYEIHIIEL